MEKEAKAEMRSQRELYWSHGSDETLTLTFTPTGTGALNYKS